jgi:hypothetical protein
MAVAVAVAFAAPAPAHAQFGKLLKKAKAKVVGGADSAAAEGGAGNASGSMQPGAPKFDATVLQLDPSLVDRMVRGMTAEVRVARVSDAKQSKINGELDALQKESDQLDTQHPSSERDAWQDANSRIDECIGDELQKREEKNEGEIQARLLSDPAARQKMAEASQRANAAMQRGDSAAARKAMEEMQALTYPGLKEDSAAAIKKCGAPVPKPAWMVHDEELEARRSKLNDELRSIGDAARDTALQVVARGGGGGAAPLTAVQYSMALERIIAWAAATAPDGKGFGKAAYSSVELDALKARDADLRKLTGELRELQIWR